MRSVLTIGVDGSLSKRSADAADIILSVFQCVLPLPGISTYPDIEESWIRTLFMPHRSIFAEIAMWVCGYTFSLFQSYQATILNLCPM